MSEERDVARQAREPLKIDRRSFLVWSAGMSLGASAFFLGATLVQALMPPKRSIDGMTEVGELAVARLSDLEVGSPVLVDYGDDRVFVVKTSANTVEVFDAACPHARCTLAYNSTARRFDCPCHGSSFSLDGALLQGPSLRGMVRALAEVRSGQVVVRGFEA